MARALRTVAPTERAKKAKTVVQAVSTGVTREMLVATRARVAAAVDDEDTPAAALAVLTKRLMEINREIEAIDARDQPEEGSSDGHESADEDFDASAV